MRDAIRIRDNGPVLPLAYESLLAYHGGGALAGVAIGYCAMAYAGQALSNGEVWNRRDLQVISWHGGPGILDAIEFVTRAITRGRFELRQIEGANIVTGDGPGCDSVSAFRFEVNDGKLFALLQLREEVVAPPFFELARMTGRTVAEEAELTRLKFEVADSVMALPLPALFELNVADQSHA
jgi:hypothetical protein